MKRVVLIRMVLALATAVAGRCIPARAADPAAMSEKHSNHEAFRVQPNRAEPATSREPLVPVEVRQFHMGMLVRLTVWAPTKAQGQAACRQAFDLVRGLDRVFSDYDPHSELSSLCRRAGEGAVPVSRELYEVVDAALSRAGESDGAYDPTAGPLIALWRQARRERTLPSAAAREEALRLVDFRAVTLDRGRRTVALARPGMRLDLGAIAKGYIGDEIVAFLRDRGLPRAAFEAGGDMVFGEPPPGEPGWPIEPLDPAAAGPLHLANCAISTSGDTVQYVEIDGRRYSHVIHAGTGMAVTNRQLCVVVAPRGCLSDPLATLGTILPPAKYRALLAAHHPQVYAKMLRLDTGETWQFGDRPPAE